MLSSIACSNQSKPISVSTVHALNTKTWLCHPQQIKYSSWSDANVRDRTGSARCCLNGRIWLHPTRLISWGNLCHDWKSMMIYQSRPISRYVRRVDQSIITPLMFLIYWYDDTALFPINRFLLIMFVLSLKTIKCHGWICILVQWNSNETLS